MEKRIKVEELPLPLYGSQKTPSHSNHYLTPVFLRTLGRARTRPLVRCFNRKSEGIKKYMGKI